MQQPVISVCIANFNGESVLGPCIDSILDQHCDVPVEIIVHDDASTDGSLALLQERYPQVQVIESDVNAGFCISNNRMVARARGDYVLLLNNDAALLPGALAALLAEAGSQLRPGILGLPQYDWETGALVDRGCRLDPFYNPIPNHDSAEARIAYVIGACLWIPREFWNELGGFPEWMESLAEDMYLCCLARFHARSVGVAGASGYRHRQGASFGGNRIGSAGLVSTTRRRKLSERNKTYVMFLFTPAPFLCGLLALHCASLIVEAAAMSLFGKNRRIAADVYGNALLSLWHNRRLLAAVRARIQRERAISRREYYGAFSALPHKITLLLRHGVPSVSS
jgi:GT2 family glycosyltransferase